MVWPILSIISALTAALINFVDKYLIEKYAKQGDVGALILFSSAIGIPASLTILFFNRSVLNVSFIEAFVLILNGIMYTLWLIPYLYALNEDETSVVSPLFQISSIITVILGFILLKETLTYSQVIGILAIMFGATGLTLEIKNIKSIKVKLRILGLMTLSCAIIAVNTVIFKSLALETNFWSAVFWEYIGFSLAFILFFTFIFSFRVDFLRMLSSNKLPIISLNLFNELLAVASKLAFNAALLLAPVGIVSFFSEGVQPVFVLLLGLTLTRFFPKTVIETTEKKVVFQKFISIIFIVVGSYLISL